jgi:hypothetical protein
MLIVQFLWINLIVFQHQHLEPGLSVGGRKGFRAVNIIQPTTAQEGADAQQLLL